MDKKTILKAIKDKENELWKPLYEYHNYVVSNYGRIKSIERVVLTGVRNGKDCFKTKPQHIIKLRTNGIEKFLFADIYYRDKKGKKFCKTVYIHRAVCDHFVEKPQHIIEYEKAGGHICATHIRKNHKHNKSTNLKWITQTELIKSQPNRLANPRKAWKTRKAIYGETGSNPDAKTGKVPRTRKPKKIETEII